MRVLFDHNLPHKLRTELGAICQHEIVTASYMGWRKLRNGELLRAAEENGFDVFVTGDQTLLSEQNLAGRRLDTGGWCGEIPVCESSGNGIIESGKRAYSDDYTTQINHSAQTGRSCLSEREYQRETLGVIG